jgi:hypothetical protein
MLMLVELATAKVQRGAGGQRILAVTSTAVIDVDPGHYGEVYLELPQHPVRSVASVTLNGVLITDWRLSSQMLWRRAGWTTGWDPSQVLVENAHGLLADDQALQLARDFTLTLAKAGWGNPTGATSQAIDDYKVTYAEADARMQLTDSMAAALRDQYGTSAYTTSSR